MKKIDKIASTPNEFSTRDLNYALIGAPLRPFSDLYHHLMRASWRHLLMFSLCIYFLINLLFAFLYFLEDGSIANVHEHSFWDCFWFSVQTFSTIGFGVMSPQTIFANVLVTIEAFVGLTSVALITALMYSKFTRPMARVAFTEFLAIHNRNGKRTLHVRISNERHNRIYNASLQLGVMVEETTQEGEEMRKFYDLELERSFSPMFVITWTATHVIDEKSPLYGVDENNISEKINFVSAIFSGIDDTYVQGIHSRKLFLPEDVAFNHRFADIIHRPGDGKLYLDLRKVHSLVPFEGQPQEAQYEHGSSKRISKN